MGRHGPAGGSAGRAAGVQMAAATPYGRRTCEPNNACPHACSLCGALCLATCAGRALLRALRDPSGRGPRCHRTDVPLDRCRNRCFRTCTPALTRDTGGVCGYSFAGLRLVICRFAVPGAGLQFPCALACCSRAALHQPPTCLHCAATGRATWADGLECCMQKAAVGAAARLLDFATARLLDCSTARMPRSSRGSKRHRPVWPRAPGSRPPAPPLPRPLKL
jgi:hypothetical protein